MNEPICQDTVGGCEDVKATRTQQRIGSISCVSQQVRDTAKSDNGASVKSVRAFSRPSVDGGRYGKPELLSDEVTCCDGICYDPTRNRILLTAAEQNAIYTWDIAQKKMSLIWANGDTDGASGLLDQPCEILLLDANR